MPRVSGFKAWGLGHIGFRVIVCACPYLGPKHTLFSLNMEAQGLPKGTKVDALRKKGLGSVIPFPEYEKPHPTTIELSQCLLWYTAVGYSMYP